MVSHSNLQECIQTNGFFISFLLTPKQKDPKQLEERNALVLNPMNPQNSMNLMKQMNSMNPMNPIDPMYPMNPMKPMNSLIP